MHGRSNPILVMAIGSGMALFAFWVAWPFQTAWHAITPLLGTALGFLSAFVWPAKGRQEGAAAVSDRQRDRQTWLIVLSAMWGGPILARVLGPLLPPQYITFVVAGGMACVGAMFFGVGLRWWKMYAPRRYE